MGVALQSMITLGSELYSKHVQLQLLYSPNVYSSVKYERRGSCEIFISIFQSALLLQMTYITAEHFPNHAIVFQILLYFAIIQYSSFNIMSGMNICFPDSN